MPCGDAEQAKVSVIVIGDFKSPNRITQPFETAIERRLAGDSVDVHIAGERIP